MFQYQPLTPSNIIEITGIIVSLITSLIAILISLKTLRQNSTMIKESTRPYISIYSRTTNFQEPGYYLVIKNFGKSGAYITSLKCNYDLSKYSYKEDHVPFKHLNGNFIAPGQSFICNIDPLKLYKAPDLLHFSIEYKSNDTVYSDYFTIDPKADSDLIQTRAATPGKELRNISYTLQDLVEKQL